MSHTPLHEVLSAFDKAVDLFNAKGNLREVFRDDVILVKAKKPMPIVGKVDVQKDFDERYKSLLCHAGDCCQYDERYKSQVSFTPTSVDVDVKDTFAVVNGVGDWLDKELQKKLPIQFVFIFQKEKNDGKWRIRTLWGSPSH